MKDKFLKYLLMIIFVSVVTLLGINDVKVNAEGWVNENNSLRYYSGPSVTTGWCEYKGDWYYLDNSGMMETGWTKIEGKWYYLDTSSGKMLTGWIEDKGKWYYFSNSGEMKIGWIQENGSLYYLNEKGEMVKDAYINSYYLGLNGAMQKQSWHDRDDNRR